jgi:hypothetical protein
MHHSLHPFTYRPRLRHACLYQFWWRSQGLWLSKLAKVTLRLLDTAELETVQHTLSYPSFGIQMAWEYQSKGGSGQMMWCVDAAQANLIFTDRGITAQSPPAVYEYRMVDASVLLTTNGEVEECTALQGDNTRLRELKQGGKLVKRIWESKFSS